MHLSLIIFIPLVLAFMVLVLPHKYREYYKYLTLIATFLQLVVVILAYMAFETGENAPLGVNNVAGFQFVEKVSWFTIDLGNFGILAVDYFLGADGISMPLLIMAAVILFIAAISSMNIKENLKGYHVLFLILSSSIMGCFIALDFFLFYLFFEFMLLPMYFLIGIWGGPRREYASIKFFLYTLAGSIFILVAIIALYLSSYDPAATISEAGHKVNTLALQDLRLDVLRGEGEPENMVHSFNMVNMMDSQNYVPGSLLDIHTDRTVLGWSPRLLVFLLLFIGFLIKLPAVPFHTWLPDAHVEAPTPISVILAGILLKIGGYGIIRTAYSIIPEGGIHFAYLIGGIGVVSIIYGGFNALAQHDLKKLIAYSSVSHMGFVLLGLAAFTMEGVNGAIFQMFSHGILSAMLFLIAGVLYDRTHDRLIDNYSGLGSVMPHFMTIVIIAFFASLGLPGFSGFIGEILVFLGAFSSAMTNALIPKWLPILATLGLLLSAAYFLWTIQRMFMGSFWIRESRWKGDLYDLDTREWIMFVPLIILTLTLGIFPGFLTEIMDGSTSVFVQEIFQHGLSNLEILTK